MLREEKFRVLSWIVIREVDLDWGRVVEDRQDFFKEFIFKQKSERYMERKKVGGKVCLVENSIFSKDL